MRRIEGSHLFPKDAASTAVALGNFDGVHLGHQKLIGRIREYAEKSGGPSIVYTFEPHPVKILAPSQCPRLLNTLDQKLRYLGDYGVDMAVVEPFTHELAKLTPEDFFREIIIKRLRASSIVAGYDFTFGMHRKGTIETLEELGKECGIDVTIVPAEFIGETLISSTVIRKMVRKGRVDEVAKFLGRPYEIGGEVVPGRGLGVTLAARTANLKPLNEIMPGDGVYWTLTSVEGSKGPMPSVTSIGDNPTFPDAHYSVETHVLGEDVELLGKRITVHFLAFMRETLRFQTIEELKAQIARDISAAKEYHARSKST